MNVQTYAAPDGSELALRSYVAPSGAPGAAVVYLHGIESHGGWFHSAAQLLQCQNYDVYCLDRRGSGLNREERGFVSGHASSFKTLIADVHRFLDSLSGRYPAVFLAGLSWGGKLALATSLNYPGACDGLVLITPGIRAQADVSAATKIRIALAAYAFPRSPIDLPLTPEMFTRSPEQQEFIRSDPLRLKQVTARFLFESWRMERFIDRRIAEHRSPIQVFLAGQDRIIDNAGVLDVLNRGQRGTLEVVTYDDQTHAIQLDAPQRLVADMARWVSTRIHTTTT